MNAIESAIRELERVQDALPDLDKHDLESRISDIQGLVELARDGGIEELPDRLRDVADALEQLYNEV